MRSDASKLRDAGLALVSRINAWLIVAAVVLTLVISAAAARSFRGHARPSAPPVAAAQGTGPAVAPGAAPQAPTAPSPAPTAPSPAPASAPAPVVSGGS